MQAVHSWALGFTVNCSTPRPAAEAALTLVQFKDVYIMLLFHVFDVNNDGFLEVPEAQKALDYISGTHFSIKETALRLEENVWRRNSGQMTSPRALHHPGPLPAETAPIRRPSSAYLDDLLEA